jgi:hypothetical protein
MLLVRPIDRKKESYFLAKAGPSWETRVKHVALGYF